MTIRRTAFSCVALAALAICQPAFGQSKIGPPDGVTLGVGDKSLGVAKTRVPTLTRTPVAPSRADGSLIEVPVAVEGIKNPG